MAVAFDAKATAELAQTTGASPADLTTLTVGAGSNRALLACILATDPAIAISSVVWDPGGAAQALTLVTGAVNTTSRYVGWYGLVNPTSGNKTLRVTFTGGASNFVVDALSFTGVDQSGGATSFPNGAASFATGAANSTIDITSATGDMVVAAHQNGTQAFTTLTGTSIFTNNTLNQINVAAHRDAGAATVTMTASWATGTDNVYKAGTSIKAAGGGVTVNGSALFAGAGLFKSNATVSAITLVLGSSVLDSGLALLDTNADKIYVCSRQPATFTEATSTFALGNKNVGVGSVFGAPAAGTPTGRKVTSVTVSDGSITGNGTVSAWAVVDSINNTLLATGNLSGAKVVTTGQIWTLDPIVIHIPSQ